MENQEKPSVNPMFIVIGAVVLLAVVGAVFMMTFGAPQTVGHSPVPADADKKMEAQRHADDYAKTMQQRYSNRAGQPGGQPGGHVGGPPAR